MEKDMNEKSTIKNEIQHVSFVDQISEKLMKSLDLLYFNHL